MNDLLLNTKLCLPILRKEIVSRVSLLERLKAGLWQEDGFFRALALLSASAGYGKTTLVAEWFRQAGYRIAWISLDESDNAPARFLSYVIAALQQRQPGFGKTTRAMIQSPQPLPGEILYNSAGQRNQRHPHADAINLAQPEGFIRAFVDAGQPLTPALEEAARQGITPAYVGKILAALGAGKKTGSPQKSLVEPLGGREIEVLRLVAAGLSNREIAEKLVVSPGTAKTHIHNLCGKLEVRNRTEAAMKARELRLV